MSHGTAFRPAICVPMVRIAHALLERGTRGHAAGQSGVGNDSGATSSHFDLAESQRMQRHPDPVANLAHRVGSRRLNPHGHRLETP